MKKPVMWILILVAVPVALAILIAIVGTLMPQNYAARGRMALDLTPPEVWTRLHDPEHYPMTGSMCKAVEVLPSENGLAVWTEDMGSSMLRIRNSESEEPRRIVRSLEDTVVPYVAHAEFTIEATETGSIVTCSNHTTIRSGTWHVPFFRVMIGLFGGAKSGCKDYLTRVSGGSGTIEWLDS